MNQEIIITPPVDEKTARSLSAGTNARITGTILTARDAALKRFRGILREGGTPPADLRGQILYFTGPAPAPPGKASGSAGPTTAARMDPFAPLLIEKTGLRGMIGKGPMGEATAAALRQFGAVYFAATGGAGALLARHIRRMEVICYEDLGTEAVRRLEVEAMPVLVAMDARGGNLYLSGPARHARPASPPQP